MGCLGNKSMFVLNGILRAESQEKILVYLLVRETGYGKAIAEFFDLSQNQKTRTPCPPTLC